MATDETAGANEAPVKSANKPEWEAFAASQGMSAEDASAATKDQLVAQFGSSATSSRRTGRVAIYAPNREYDGVVAGVAFAKGRADADYGTDAVAIGYFQRQGYGIGERPARPAPALEPAVSAIEAAAIASVGGRLRDAAVDPYPDDFLPPVNAGKFDPHGPRVVSPEIHHDGPAGLRPGVVAVDDPARQSREESEVAEAILIEHQTHDEALGTFGPGDDTGDLGLSDPGSAEAGREAAREVVVATLETAAELDADEGEPARNAATAEWAAFAIAQGMDPGEAEAAKRQELIDRYGSEG